MEAPVDGNHKKGYGQGCVPVDSERFESYYVTIMSVTLHVPARVLDDLLRQSIDLAVGQWMRDPVTTFAARAGLRAAGVPESEIEERRRARSADPELARVLFFAVTTVITHGRPEERDVRRLGPLGDPAMVAAILDAVASSRARVTFASALAGTTPHPPIDMNIGDY